MRTLQMTPSLIIVFGATATVAERREVRELGLNPENIPNREPIVSAWTSGKEIWYRYQGRTHRISFSQLARMGPWARKFTAALQRRGVTVELPNGKKEISLIATRGVIRHYVSKAQRTDIWVEQLTMKSISQHRWQVAAVVTVNP